MSSPTYSYTADDIKELILCKNDPSYFIKKYLDIDDSDAIGKLVNGNFIGVNYTRDASEKIAAYILWKSIFNQDARFAIMSKRIPYFTKILNVMLDLIPPHLMPASRRNNMFELSFDNNSAINFLSFNSNSLRGRTLNLLYVDDVASVNIGELNNIFECIIPSMYAITGRQLILTAKDGTFVDHDKVIFTKVVI